MPFVDHVLVESAFPLSQSVKIGPRWQPKRLLRQALAPRLTPAHLRAPKRGFVGPTTAWLRNELSGMLTDELSAARQQRLGYFEPAAIQTALREHLTGRQNRERILWRYCAFRFGTGCIASEQSEPLQRLDERREWIGPPPDFVATAADR